jgi:homoserine kinase
MSNPDRVTAFAPGTVANVAVGFDVLGFAVAGAGDRVTATRGGPEPVTIDAVTGVVPDLPLDPSRNTAAVAVRAMLDDLGLDERLTLTVEKGLPLSSGMGGSAASAVAAVVAANELLGRPASLDAQLAYALQGEAAASGAPHADNAAPSLHGGLVAVLPGERPEVVPIPVPESLLCVLVNPRIHVETREARSILRPEITLADHARQSAHLAAFVAACCSDDVALIGRSLRDVLIEPQRSQAIPGFARAQSAAIGLGALGCSIAGSGPSVFAWVSSRGTAESVARSIAKVFEDEGLESESWISPVNAPGARVVS